MAIIPRLPLSFHEFSFRFPPLSAVGNYLRHLVIHIHRIFSIMRAFSEWHPILNKVFS